MSEENTNPTAALNSMVDAFERSFPADYRPAAGRAEAAARAADTMDSTAAREQRAAEWLAGLSAPVKANAN